MITIVTVTMIEAPLLDTVTETTNLKMAVSVMKNLQTEDMTEMIMNEITTGTTTGIMIEIMTGMITTGTIMTEMIMMTMTGIPSRMNMTILIAAIKTYLTQITGKKSQGKNQVN